MDFANREWACNPHSPAGIAAADKVAEYKRQQYAKEKHNAFPWVNTLCLAALAALIAINAYYGVWAI